MFIEMMTIQKKKKNHVLWESCSLMLHTGRQRSALFNTAAISVVNLHILNICST